MVQLDLNKDEIDIMLQVLDSYLSDLRMEIADTDRMEFRDMLKHRKGVITKVIEALSAAG